MLTIRGGTTVEVFNTDAEGRLVMADALVLATEDGVDAIVDDRHPDRRGAADVRRRRSPAVLGNDPAWSTSSTAAGDAADEPVWELPLVQRYRRQLDSTIADIKNMGGENAGTITAGAVPRGVRRRHPFGHLDICGPMMTDADDPGDRRARPGSARGCSCELALDFRRRH